MMLSLHFGRHFWLDDDNELMSCPTFVDGNPDLFNEDYVELVVDNMDIKTMIQYITDDLRCHYESVSLHELKDEIDNFDEELYDELVDNVTNETVLDVNNNGGKY